MRKLIKRITLLAFVVILSINCEKEEISNNNLETNEKQNNYQLKKLRFSQLKRNKKAFDKLVEARIKKNPSLEYRGAYNSDFGVFIDTTNITLIESEDSHSYTFQIINENIQEFENLILNYKNNGDYSAYISKYNLTQEQINNLIDSGSLTNIAPTSISEVNSTLSIPISGDGSDCVDIVTYSTNMCYNSQGNLMESNGELGNGCVGMSFPVEHMIMVIDADCMSGGGPGGYDGSGGDNGGYNPGSGGTGGFGGNTGGTGGNTGGTGGSTGNPPNDGGNSTNPIEIVDEDNNPIVTSPVININKTEVKLLNSLTPQQNDWWNDPSTSQETKDDIINYLNENNDNQTQAEEAINFVKASIQSIQNEEVDNFQEFKDAFTNDTWDEDESAQQRNTLCGSYNFTTVGDASVANISGLGMSIRRGFVAMNVTFNNPICVTIPYTIPSQSSTLFKNAWNVSISELYTYLNATYTITAPSYEKLKELLIYFLSTNIGIMQMGATISTNPCSGNIPTTQATYCP